jgi:hypothetical protein
MQKFFTYISTTSINHYNLNLPPEVVGATATAFEALFAAAP